MKFKDIEKKLKSEQNEKSVPDVYARVSQAPLNKLLSGETPARAFQKQQVMRLLTFVLALFLVVAIGLSAIWLTPAESPSVPDCYVSVTVTSEGKDMRIGLVMSGGRNVITAVVEMTDGNVNAQPIVSHKSRISDFIEPKSNDKVEILILSVKSTAITESARFIAGELETTYNRLPFEMSTSANSSLVRENVAQYIAVCGGQVDDGASISTLIQTYAELFA